MPWKWYASADEEHYTVGPCDSREAAVQEAIGQELGIADDLATAAFYIIEAQQGPVDLSRFVNGECLIEQIIEWAMETYFTLDDDELAVCERFNEAHVVALEEAVKAAVRQWQAACNIEITPTQFTATRNAERIEHVYPAEGRTP